MVTLREITEDTLRPFLKMEVSEKQKQFVAPNSVSISQAYFNNTAWFRGIYADDTPVGFVMLSIDREEPEYWVCRLMIDQHQQGNGYGYAAMELILEYVRTLPGAKELKLSYEPGEGDPSGFYRKLGFEETGEMNKDERVMKLTL